MCLRHKQTKLRSMPIWNPVPAYQLCCGFLHSLSLSSSFLSMCVTTGTGIAHWLYQLVAECGEGSSTNDSKKSEPVVINLLRGPGIDSQPGRPVRQPYKLYRPAGLHTLGSFNMYKYGLWSFYILLIHEVRLTYHRSLLFKVVTLLEACLAYRIKYQYLYILYLCRWLQLAQLAKGKKSRP